MSQETNIFPDNTFFENPDGRPKGGSWNGEVDGIKATYGAIEPGTTATYSIDSREIISVEKGQVSVSFVNNDGKVIFGVHNEGDLFELPVGKDFTLSVLGEDKFVYGCLYPDSE